MPDFTISITDNEKKCLDTVMVGIGTWAANGLQNRAHHAQEKILDDLYKHCKKNALKSVEKFDCRYSCDLIH